MTIETPELRQVIAYPPFQPRSINDMLPIGVTRDGEPIGPRLREGGCYLWGKKGSGTTTMRLALTASVIQCVDALVWAGDVDGFPDLRPFAPAIDWSTTTVHGVKTMVEAALNIALERKRSSYEIKMAANSNDVPVGNGAAGQAPPAIVLMLTDRAAQPVMEQLEFIRDLSRDTAIIPVIEAKRAVEYSDAAWRAGLPNRIGMRVTDPTELAYGFGRYDLDPAEIRHQGDGFITTGKWLGDVVPFRGMLIRPQQCEEIAEQAARVRPVLEAHSRTLAGDAYADRK